MRWLILSDLHSNLEATQSVIAHARAAGFDRVAVLGDIVGYGANPNEVIDAVRALSPDAIVRGNHDKVAAGVAEAETFNDVAWEAVMWTRGELHDESIEYLRNLPQGPADAGGFLISHGTPLDEEDYLLGVRDAENTLKGMQFGLAFFGHTHFACAFALAPGASPSLEMLCEDDVQVKLLPGLRYLINPGSIGQPRDHNPHAAYAIFDTDSRVVRISRVPYDVASAQSRIRAAGLPSILAERLSLGV